MFARSKLRPPRETRSISARTMRSTRLGRLSSSHDLSIGRSISFTRSSSVRAFCPMMVCASELNALSTAAHGLVRDQPAIELRGSGFVLNTTSDVPSIVRKPGPVSAAAVVLASPARPWPRSDRARRASMLLPPQVRHRVLRASRRCHPDCWLSHWPPCWSALRLWRRRRRGRFRWRRGGGAGRPEPPLRQAVVSARAAASGVLAGLAGVVIGNDAPDGGQDFLHRGLLRLRRLRHYP